MWKGWGEGERMVLVKVDVTNPELNALEDLAVVWTLCKKHTGIINASDDDYWKFTRTCKKCIELNKKIRNKALHLWSKLVTAYQNSTAKGGKK